MKVLFAVSDENISESIIKEYQKQYKEIISYKNVYYFNAIIKELQKDKNYDRIVISEDLEPFASNNYDSIDKFIFEKLDDISDEAIDPTGQDTQIILITTDRRNFGDSMLVKFFGIGVYSALIGQDKSIENVCELIKKPRTKKEAKLYYKIDSDDVNYQSENENDVSETEIQNILSHYKKLGKSTEKYVDSFNNIVSQYNDEQLKIIINFLPVGVKATLEAESPKYQELVMSSGKSVKKQKKPGETQYVPKKIENYNAKTVKVAQNKYNPNDIKIDMLEAKMNSPKMTKPVVIPTALEAKPIKKVPIEEPVVEDPEPINVKMDYLDSFSEIDEQMDNDTNYNSNNNSIEEVIVEQAPKKGRGRPRKNPVIEPNLQEASVQGEQKRGRGRPKKQVEPTIQESVQQEDVNLFGLEEEQQQEDVNLFGLEQETRQVNHVNPTIGRTEEYNTKQKMNQEYANSIMQRQYNSNIDLSSLITRDKKIVSFVGTTKNGTSFIVNNLAELFSSMGISTAILDATQSKNSYYIYTKNEESLRKISENCINNLRSNIPEGIKVNKNLTVYTPIPGANQSMNDVENILSTLIQNYSLVLIDCDFETPVEYFYNSQEIYLVQSMDVLTIQPLTAFLRDLKNKNVLDEQKIKIVINKEQRVPGLSPKMIIGGMAFYNDPSMSFMTELFDRARVKYMTIPFEMQNYIGYLEALLNCNITLKPYTKLFNAKLRELGDMVYPLIAQQYGRSSFSIK